MTNQNLGIVSPVPCGDWTQNTSYQKLSVVRSNGGSYIARISVPANIEPSVTSSWETYWMLLNADGEVGEQGPQGGVGEGVPTGGLTGQVLAKGSDTNYDTEWIPQSQIAAGTAVNDKNGNDIAETYETKSDATEKNATLQGQITENTNNIDSNTNQLVKSAELISRNSKRLDGLEQRINPSPFVTDSTVAYQKDVPSNAVGATELQEIGGMTYNDGETLKSSPVTAVTSKGANLIYFPYFNRSGYTNNGITYTVTDDGYVIANGTATADSVFYLRYVAPHPILTLEQGETYTLSGCASGGTNSTFRMLLQDTSFSQGVAVYGDSKTFTASYTRYYLSIRILTGYTANNLTFKPMINKGSTALTYKPYVEPKSFSIPTEVQALDGYGEGVSDTVFNSIEWSEDGKILYNKRVGAVDLGSLTWYRSESLSGAPAPLLYATIPNIGGTVIGGLPCVSLWGYTYSQWASADKTFTKTSYTSQGNIFIRDSSFTDAATFKAAMSGVMLYYELGTPEVTDISDLITADNMLSVEGGGALTFENENSQAVPSTVEYITAEANA